MVGVSVVVVIGSTEMRDGRVTPGGETVDGICSGDSPDWSPSP